MNIQTLYHFRASLLVLLLGAPWCGAAVVHFHAALGNPSICSEHHSPANREYEGPIICTADDFSSLPALLRFNGKTLIGMEDSLTVFQHVKACADSPLALLFDARSGFKDTVYVGSSALSEQTLFLQHTRLQI
jgi:hypothetical protein